MADRRRLGAGGAIAALGAVVAGGCFFLPYVRLLRVFGASVTFSGPRIGGALWLVPGTAAAILLAQFGIRGPAGRLRAGVVAGLAAVGVLLVVAVLLRIHHRTGFLVIHFSAATFGVRPALGWGGSLAGFIVTLVAAARVVFGRGNGHRPANRD